jgi:LacI family transcriptional regulator
MNIQHAAGPAVGRTEQQKACAAIQNVSEIKNRRSKTFRHRMRRRCTLKELAGAAEVSVATASRALAGYDDVALRTRERVRELARTMGYVPNMAGRMLVSGRTGFVGLVLPVRGPDFVDSFLGDFVTGLGEGLVEQGSDLFIAAASQGQTEMEVLEHIVRAGRVDGIVLTRIGEDDPRIRFLIDQHVPFVAHGRMEAPEPFSWLDTDGASAFATAFRMLYDLGHRRFGLISITEAMGFRRDREQGVRAAAMQADDPAVTLQEIHLPRFDAPAHRAGIRALLQRPDRPTALLALFDELGLMAMQEAYALGLRVPQDLSVIGFDNLPAAGFATPGLTTFDQETRESARQIARMLTGQLRNRDNEPATTLRQPMLVARGSHGPAP